MKSQGTPVTRPAVPNTESAKRLPHVGDTWRSRDPRDNGLTVTVLDVWADSSHKWVRIQRFRKTNVSLRRFHRDYEFVSGGVS